MARCLLFYYHVTTNSFGVMIGLLGNKQIQYNKIKTGNNGRIKVLKAGTNDDIFDKSL